MQEKAEKIYQLIARECKTEEDQLELCSILLKKICKDTDISKIHASGLPEMLACKAIGLKWNGKNIHGADATDKVGRGVEIKTYKRVQNKNTININYTYPPREKGASDETNRRNIVKYFLESEKFTGGHYWVCFDQSKSEIYHWNYIDRKTVAQLVNEHLQRNPTSKSINFGGALCHDCRRNHKIDALAKPVILIDRDIHQKCTK